MKECQFLQQTFSVFEIDFWHRKQIP